MQDSISGKKQDTQQCIENGVFVSETRDYEVSMLILLCLHEEVLGTKKVVNYGE